MPKKVKNNALLKRIPSTQSMASLHELRVAQPSDAADETDAGHNLEYEVTLMYGRYSSNLAEYARQEASRVRDEERNKDELLFSKELQPYRGRLARTIIRLIRPIWDHTFARLGEDWVFLFIMGILMATISLFIDYIVLICFKARMYLHEELLNDIHWTLQIFAWVTIPTLLVIFSAAFVQWLAPSAAGSGIPEMKTILRGVILKEYLTWRTLVAKIVGLATVIGAGLPLGKEGPVMHMASIISTMLMNVLRCIKGVVDSEAHSTDLLAAACTMGVAVCYAAPIGGVLFSIEVTTVYFAVRNYWRGFFASVVGALFYRLMGVWFMNEDTIYPIFKVEHNFQFPYDVIELLPFLCIGIICGFVGSLFVFLHRRYVIFVRQNKTLKKFLNKKRLLYPTFISIMISMTTFPLVLGQFMASTSTTKQQILDLFSNVTWTVMPGAEMTLQQQTILEHWGLGITPSFHLSLFIFQIMTVFHIAVASTLPVPSGILIPLLTVGAAFGRQIGEIMAMLYPSGIHPGFPIIPGAYAMVGAASFCAAITHTISISVIVFELTGQITYVIPIMIGVLIANCISSLLQPSIYDSVIRIKKLPYLPDIITTTSDVYNIYVEDIMVRDVKYVWYGITYMDLKKVAKENRKLKYFPIVDKHDSMILLGSIPRIEIVRLLVDQVSSDKRRHEAHLRHLEALKKRWEEEDALELPTKSSSRIHYEDEINTWSEEEDEVSNRILRRLSRSLSRSSRSLTRSLSRSLSTSRHHSPASDNSSEDEQTAQEEFDHMSDSDSTPPNSPAIKTLKDLFPHKKFDANSKKNAESVSTDEGDASSEDTSPRSLDIKDPSQSNQNKFLAKKSGIELIKRLQKKPKTEVVKQKLRLARSNSLDSLRTDVRKKASVATDVLSAVDDASESPLSPSHKKGKGILKRRNSFSLGYLGPSGNFLSPNGDSNYQTVTVVDTKLRNAMERVRKRIDTASSLSQLSLFKSKKKEIGKKREMDMTPEEREVWELRELSKEVDFTKCHIDPSPFQLVERTSLLRVHSLFSMLGINHAYVTAIGRLIGVVALKELRTTIEGQYVGKNGGAQSPPLKSPSMQNLGPSPQRMTTNAKLSPLDPEAGIITKRSPFSANKREQNGFTNNNIS